MDSMRAVAPVFQVYRFGSDTSVWWRMVSTNGRGLARTAYAHESVDEARAAIGVVGIRAAELEASLRLTERARWHWALSLAGVPVVESTNDLDRRVRCDHAWRTFVALAPISRIDPVVHTYRAVVAARPSAMRGAQ
jgi:hypothetical protein